MNKFFSYYKFYYSMISHGPAPSQMFSGLHATEYIQDQTKGLSSWHIFILLTSAT